MAVFVLLMTLRKKIMKKAVSVFDVWVPKGKCVISLFFFFSSLTIQVDYKQVKEMKSKEIIFSVEHGI